MENKTGFDLNAALATWRAGFAAREGMSAEALRELEAHLRDGVTAWTAKGLSEEEAFTVAARRVGSAAAVAKEFEREDVTNVWRVRAFWMLVGIVGMNVLSEATKTVASLSAAGANAVLGFRGTDGLIFTSMVWFAFMVVALGASVRWILAGNAARLHFWKKWSSRTVLAMAVLALLIVPIFLAHFSLMVVYSMAENGAVQISVTSYTVFLGALLYSVGLACLLARLAPDAVFARKA